MPRVNRAGPVARRFDAGPAIFAADRAGSRCKRHKMASRCMWTERAARSRFGANPGRFDVDPSESFLIGRDRTSMFPAEPEGGNSSASIWDYMFHVEHCAGGLSGSNTPAFTLVAAARRAESREFRTEAGNYDLEGLRCDQFDQIVQTRAVQLR